MVMSATTRFHGPRRREQDRVQSTRRGRLVRILGNDLWTEKCRCNIPTEIYIDDVVVKSKSAGGHLEDLRQVLE